MPAATTSFRVPADAARIASVLKDLDFLSRAVPNVVRVEPIDATTAIWTVNIKLGPLNRKSVFTGTLLEATDRTFHFRATGSDATIDGVLDLTPLSPSETEVAVSLTMNGAGPLRVVIDNYLGRRIHDDANGFARALQERLRSSNGPGEALGTERAID